MKLENVVIVCANDESRIAQKKNYSKEHMIEDYLQKPFTKDKLANILVHVSCI